MFNRKNTNNSVLDDVLRNRVYLVVEVFRILSLEFVTRLFFLKADKRERASFRLVRRFYFVLFGRENNSKMNQNISFC
jgi:hypothetical protein